MNIEQLMKDYGAYIYNYSFKLTCHPVDAEDITQETFIQAWKNLNSLQSENAVKSWLTKICYHQFLMKIRQTGRKMEELVEEIDLLEQEGHILPEIIPSPEDEVLVGEEIKELQNGCFYAMVRKLTLHQRIVFSLVDMYGMKVDEVAQILETSVLATKGLLHRARMNIDSFFADHCNLIYMKNPCRCKAWIEFSKKRDGLQKQTEKLIEALDYKENNYHNNPEVRRKIKYLYANMPDKKPDSKWYEKVLLILENY